MPDEPKPQLTDAERHERFKEMAREVDASDKADDFDEAFKRIAPKKTKDSTVEPSRSRKA